jgi:hypothetical protein
MPIVWSGLPGTLCVMKRDEVPTCNMITRRIIFCISKHFYKMLIYDDTEELERYRLQESKISMVWKRNLYVFSS